MRIAPQNLVILALGSNLGDSRQILPAAMERLAGFAERIFLRSSIWETQPVDCPPGSPVFLNAAVGLVPRLRLTPESLLAQLKKIEARAGRKAKTCMNEPRTLDLDIITFQTELRNTPDLVVPHPRAHLRAFVLAPIAEIAPMLVLPGHTKTISELLRGLPPAEIASVKKLI